MPPSKLPKSHVFGVPLAVEMLVLALLVPPHPALAQQTSKNSKRAPAAVTAPRKSDAQLQAEKTEVRDKLRRIQFAQSRMREAGHQIWLYSEEMLTEARKAQRVAAANSLLKAADAVASIAEQFPGSKPVAQTWKTVRELTGALAAENELDVELGKGKTIARAMDLVGAESPAAALGAAFNAADAANKAAKDKTTEAVIATMKALNNTAKAMGSGEQVKVFKLGTNLTSDAFEWLKELDKIGQGTDLVAEAEVLRSAQFNRMAEADVAFKAKEQSYEKKLDALTAELRSRGVFEQVPSYEFVRIKGPEVKIQTLRPMEIQTVQTVKSLPSQTLEPLRIQTYEIPRYEVRPPAVEQPLSTGEKWMKVFEAASIVANTYTAIANSTQKATPLYTPQLPASAYSAASPQTNGPAAIVASTPRPQPVQPNVEINHKATCQQEYDARNAGLRWWAAYCNGVPYGKALCFEGYENAQQMASTKLTACLLGK